ncbi:MAG: class I SAM-dependent methyltransferase, partial [Candidatus Aenigmarchaeota archaeon]|nr:class I SAM-dependent methyltransferase [Candidatus Aenigmarchaeota archaeon]
MTDISSQNSKAFGCHHRLPRKLVNRIEYIISRCEGRRVLHVGCADYDSSSCGWEQAIPNVRWLHGQISKVAEEVIGIDNSLEAVKKIQSQYGVNGIYVGDAEYIDRLGKGTFDVVVAGEIIEHMPRPGNLLESCRNILRENGKLIITTANAYCLRRFIRIPFGKESIHSDHVAYYSHRTLQKLSQLCGYNVVEQCSYRLPNRKPLFPYLVECISSGI